MSEFSMSSMINGYRWNIDIVICIFYSTCYTYVICLEIGSTERLMDQYPGIFDMKRRFDYMHVKICIKLNEIFDINLVKLDKPIEIFSRILQKFHFWSP